MSMFSVATHLHRAIYILDPGSVDLIYGPEERRDLAARLDFYAPAQSRDSVFQNPSLLRDAEIIFSGWGSPLMDEAFLNAAPNLRAVFYGSGSIRAFVTPAFWQRGITVTSAYAANAQPVAEYTLGVILLSLKHFWKFAAATRANAGWGDHTRHVPGNFRSTVGLISGGMIARRTLELLRAFDLRRVLYCPFMTAGEAQELGVELCSLSEVFRRADVVSLHTPNLPETRGLITGEHFAAMKPGATFINSARGAVVRESEMIAVLQDRPDLQAVLDVCDPEPPAADSPLVTLANVVLTPHIAGSLGPECRRLGRYMVEELDRYLAGTPLKWQITEAQAARLA
jgi:phosphoglycerate dehydrogenase-like enzyme